ncbi:MAG: hypothetical protein ROM54_03855, partial [Anaerobiospirillum sp.]|nr:hypothetical protein [Anaerobiospirillum sp.]
MKVSNNAVNFLLAQYRAIFKRAYIKGIASAVLLTAGLAAGAAQAADNFYFNNPDGHWTQASETNPSGDYFNAQIVGGNNYENDEENTVTTTDNVLSGGLFNIGGDSTAKNYLESVTSGTVTAAYGNAKTGDITVTNNAVYVSGSGTVDADKATVPSRGSIYGAYVKAQDGKAIVSDNKVIVQKDKASVVKAAASDGYIGAKIDEGKLGAQATNNLVQITGYAGALQVVNASDNTWDVLGAFIATDESNTSTATFEASNNKVDLDYIKVTGAGAREEKSGGGKATVNKGLYILGSMIAPEGSGDYTVISSGNEVSLSNSQIVSDGDNNNTTGIHDSIRIVGGRMGYQVWNGSITMQNNKVNLVDTSVERSGSYAQQIVLAGTEVWDVQSKSVTATGNELNLEATKATEIDATLAAGAIVRDQNNTASSLNLTATGNKVTVGKNVTLTLDDDGVLAGAHVLASGTAIQSLKASNNSVEIEGTVHGDVAAFMLDDKDGTVAAGVLEASNNVVTLANGAKVDSGSIIAGEGPGSAINIKSGSTYTANDDKNALISDIINIDGNIEVAQDKALDIKGYYADGDPDATTFNANLTKVSDTASITNSGTINVYGKMVVDEGASLVATSGGAALKIDSSKAITDFESEVEDAGYGHLAIYKETLKTYLNGSDAIEDSASGAVVVSSGTLEFLGSEQVDLATDFILSGGTTAGAGKISVSGATIMGENLKVSGKLPNVQASHELLLEATNLTLGSDTYQGTDSLGFSGATAQNLKFVGDFNLADKVTLSSTRSITQNDTKLEVSADGTITGDATFVSGGSLTVELGNYTASGDFAISGGALTVQNTGAASKADSTLKLTGALDIVTNSTAAGSITVDGSGATDAATKLDLTEADVSFTASGDKSFSLKVQNGGELLAEGRDLETLLNANLDSNSGAQVVLSGGTISLEGNASIAADKLISTGSAADGKLLFSGSGNTLEINGQLTLTGTSNVNIGAGNNLVAGSLQLKNVSSNKATLQTGNISVYEALTTSTATNTISVSGATLSLGGWADLGEDATYDQALTTTGLIEGNLSVDATSSSVKVLNGTWTGSSSTVTVNSGSLVVGQTGMVDASGAAITATLDIAKLDAKTAYAVSADEVTGGVEVRAGSTIKTTELNAAANSINVDGTMEVAGKYDSGSNAEDASDDTYGVNLASGSVVVNYGGKLNFGEVATDAITLGTEAGKLIQVAGNTFAAGAINLSGGEVGFAFDSTQSFSKDAIAELRADIFGVTAGKLVDGFINLGEGTIQGMPSGSGDIAWDDLEGFSDIIADVTTNNLQQNTVT